MSSITTEEMIPEELLMEQKEEKVIYFPGLNGLRAISAIAVVISHITLGLGHFGLNPHIFGTYADGNPRGLSLAGYGVTIFFVLSGFLITFLLLEEKEHHSVNVRKFYIRRILRIWPLYYLYLSVCLFAILVLDMELNTNSLLFYIFYAANIPFIINTSLPFLSHYWSLGVEEQFYLFWPWVVRRSGTVLLICILSVALLISTKVYLHLFMPGSVAETAIHVTRFHCMFIGAAGAILYKNRNTIFIRFTDNKISQLLCWSILLLVALNRFHIASFIDSEIIAFVALVVIIGQINVQNRLINLELPVMDFLGKISYGMYVIHPLLIFLTGQLFKNFQIQETVKYLMVYGVIMSVTIGLSYLSFRYFENYFMKLKKRFEVVQSAVSFRNISMRSNS
jgi:peptidoglycan/LPS O-acetylase OafA/YrhL